MQAHYRSNMDMTNDALIATEKGYNRLIEAMKTLSSLNTAGESSQDVKALVASFYNAMNDDFNAPILIANLFDAAKFINTIKDGNAAISSVDLELLIKEMNTFVFDVLGMKAETESTNDRLSPVMDLVLDLRQEARESKNWTTSDKIRDGLAAAGITVKDAKEGTTWN